MSKAATVPDLIERILAPLVLGGPLRPLRPIGASRALRMAETSAQLSTETSRLIDLERVRRARSLCPVDFVDPIGRAELLMAAALNDLMQCCHPDLNGWLSPKRSQQLAVSVASTLRQVGSPVVLREVLARHSTFSQLLKIQRTDMRVEWWCGSAVFRGMPIPSRLLTWPEVRRVRTTSDTRPLVEQLQDAARGSSDIFLELLTGLLQTSPLTDLATCHRQLPAFRFCVGTFQMIQPGPGQVLALRVLRTAPHDRAIASIQLAAKTLTGPAQLAADAFCRQLRVFHSATEVADSP